MLMRKNVNNDESLLGILDILGAFHFAKLTSQRSAGIPEEHGTTFSD